MTAYGTPAADNLAEQIEDRQKRLADALFGLFRTLGSALQVDRVANIGLLTLTGQLLIKCAAYFGRSGTNYRLVSTVGAHGEVTGPGRATRRGGRGVVASARPWRGTRGSD